MKNKFIFILGLVLVFFSPKVTQAMHIMEGFLPVKWAIFWIAISIPFVFMGLKKIKDIFSENPDKKVLLGLVGAFVFVLSALKIPSVTGSCSHPTGTGLGAILFGPSIMSVVGLIVLLFQALLLAHGGLTTIGANAFSMAIAGPIIAFIVYKSFKKVNKKLAIFLAATLGNLGTYCITSLQLALAHPDQVSGVVGALTKFLSIFALTQIPLAIGEGLLTVVIYNVLVEYKKEGGVILENI